MRTHGTLTRWNDDRGFGFITPAAQGARELFVHVSAFPPGERPRLNEVISFEVEAGPDGRKRAVSIMRPGQPRTSRPDQRVARTPAASRGQRERRGGRRLSVAISMLLVVMDGDGDGEPCESQWCN